MSSKHSDPLRDFISNFKHLFKITLMSYRQLELPHKISESAKAVVVLSPYSLQHVFPREWVTKSYRKTIVERPERLLASSMGISAAITMYPSLFTLKSSHQRKGSLMAPHVLKVHGSSWPAELIELCQMADAKLLKGEIEVPDTWNSGDIYLSSKTIKALQGNNWGH
ncbi:CRB_1a_G0054940.mRNA.1.CDS.1 [Saccharomyces cerevisiae]|nr:CRB_1a_G0054940.mRNA.1.CDS.1 [Saccharomyces cerevisiae]CAI7480699.1 CRB_1a_G0054940.mRNA.1.CDS.1 [Saccharomyces cerevisiae]